MSSKIKIGILVILLIVIALQLSPIGLGDNYARFRFLIVILCGFLLLCSFKLKRVLSINVFLIFFISLVGYIFFLGLISFFVSQVNWGPCFDLLMPFIFIVIAYNMHLTNSQYVKILNLFVWSALFIGLTCIYTYAAGFVINDQYMPVPKNQIAPLLAVGCLVSFFLGANIHKRWQRIYYWGLAFLLFLCICVFRARANLLAIFVCLLIYIVFYKRKISTVFIGGIGGVIVLLLTPLGQFVYDAIFANYDVSDLNSVSAGRTITYIQSLEFIYNNWGFGKLSSPVLPHDGIVHNYVLYILENYGFVGGFLLLFCYLKFWSEIGRKNLAVKNMKLYHIGLWVILVPLVVSFFEYTYPYSPGSAVFMAYFCLGQYYRKEESMLINESKFM